MREDVRRDCTEIQCETQNLEVVARRLGFGRSLAYELARRNEFPVPIIRAGRRLLVSRAAVDRLLAAEPATPTRDSR